MGIRWADLAKDAGLKPQQLSDLRKTDPSMAVLRGLWKALQRREAPEELIRMAVTGVAVDLLDSETRAVLDFLPLAFPQRELLTDSTVKTRCVISHTLGEGFAKDILGHTLGQMQKYETDYFYFCPSANNQKRKVYAYAEKEITGSIDVLSTRAYFIQAPRTLFFVRTQIDNIGTPSQKAFYSFGPAKAAVVAEAELTEVEQMSQVLCEVVLRVQAGEREIQVSDPSDSLDLGFEVV